MNREQAINYLRSSGMSKKQIDAITDAFENPYLKALEDIRAEIEALDEGITSYHNDNPWVYKSEVLEIIDKHIGKEN